jgi:hypothetical protein
MITFICVLGGIFYVGLSIVIGVRKNQDIVDNPNYDDAKYGADVILIALVWPIFALFNFIFFCCEKFGAFVRKFVRETS